MKVCIAEKPSVAREIASILGAKNRKDGYYEGNGYQITWTIGHLCTLKEPQDYNPQLKWWKMHHLPILPTRFGIKEINNQGIQKQLGIIGKLVEKAEEVINCGDAGQEGEVIQRWVLTKVKCKKPVKRLWISSLTEEAIKEGFNKLKDSKDFDLLYAAGSSRAIGDWLLGINATRLYTLKYGEGKQVLSIGRVQTPTLALIVNRHLEIENFKPQTYWELKTKYRNVLFSAKSGKFFSVEEAEEVLNNIKDKPFKIISFKKKNGKESPPKLFDLTSLQVECNKKFGLSADQTLKTVQNLYEKKLVTYPRVDTVYLPTDMYPKMKGVLSKLSGYEHLTQPLLDAPIRKSKNVFNDKKVTDHHAIIPTSVKAGSLYGNEANVYNLIVLRFLAALYPDCKISKTEVIGEADKTEFKATGKQILDEGWRKVYMEEKKDDDNNEQDDDQLLPEFKEGESGPHEPALAEKQTRPPKPFTEATLLRAMETAGKQVADDELRDLMKENGIGRPSTRANIIETLFRRNYIRKERKNLVPTVTGIQLIQTIDFELLKSAELTGNWEKKLRDIEKGAYETKTFLNEMKEMVSKIVQHVKKSKGEKIEIEVQEETKPQPNKKVEAKTPSCPKCKKGNMLKGSKAYGCSEYKNGCKFIVPFVYNEKKLTEKQIFSLISKGKTSVIKGFKIDNQSIEGILSLDENCKVVFEKKEKKTVKTEALSCPKCKKGHILQGKTAYGCSEWKAGCKLRIPLTWWGKEINKTHLGHLLSGKETSLIKGFVKNETGEKVDGKLKLNNDFMMEFISSKE
ncbi:DNA topoisomerase 3 [Cytophagaceae bacterium ABcell3]|nr:DNA topoisomerase 3 [Cytophagaceae bacterium ABcell3]